MEKRSDRNKNKNNNKNKKKISKRNKVIFSIVLVLLFIVTALGSFTFFQLNKIKSTKLPTNDADLGIKSDTLKKIQQEDADVTNIALFGLDLRQKGENGRSDSIMIVSIDRKHKKIKLSSVMRDTYVDVYGHGKTKINHAHSYGGAPLAIRTLNENFDLDIRDYISVDIYSLEKVIDALGGVTINVKKEEIPQINLDQQEVAENSKSTFQPVTNAGTQLLNGRQAVGYARIRAIGNGDFERTDRQRSVLNAVFQKVETTGITKYPEIVSKVLPYIETSMSKIDIIKLGTSVLTSGTTSLDQMRFPIDGYCNAKTIDGVWYLVADMPATVDQIHKYIYQDIKPTPGTPKF